VEVDTFLVEEQSEDSMLRVPGGFQIEVRHARVDWRLIALAGGAQQSDTYTPSTSYIIMRYYGGRGRTGNTYRTSRNSCPTLSRRV